MFWKKEPPPPPPPPPSLFSSAKSKVSAAAATSAAAASLAANATKDVAIKVKDKAVEIASDPEFQEKGKFAGAIVVGGIVLQTVTSVLFRAVFRRGKKHKTSKQKKVAAAQNGDVAVDSGDESSTREKVPPTGVEVAVFDIDGTLVNSVPFMWRSWQLALRRSGLRLRESDYYADTGKSAREVFAQLATQQGVKFRFDSDVRPLLQRGYNIEISNGHPHPVAVVNRLAKLHKERGHKVAVCSTSPRIQVYDALARCGLPRSFFDAVVCGEEARDATAAYRIACKRLGVDPSSIVAYDDSPHGLEAAEALGMKLVDVTLLPGYPRNKAGLGAASPNGSPVSAHGISYQLDAHCVRDASPNGSITSSPYKAIGMMNGRSRPSSPDLGALPKVSSEFDEPRPLSPGKLTYAGVQSKVAANWKHSPMRPLSSKTNGSTGEVKASNKRTTKRKLQGQFDRPSVSNFR